MPRSPIHLRRTDLPWRVSSLTLCGLEASTMRGGTESVAEWKSWWRENTPTLSWATVRVTRSQAAERYCVTCRAVANHWPEWVDDPIGRMGRECDTLSGGNRKKRPAILRDLQCIATLIERHRAEFDDLVAGETVLAALMGNGKR